MAITAIELKNLFSSLNLNTLMKNGKIPIQISCCKEFCIMTSVTTGSMDTGIDTMGIVAISRISTVIVAIGIFTIGIVATGAINIGIIAVDTVTSGTVATCLVATSMFFQWSIERSLISHA